MIDPGEYRTYIKQYYEGEKVPLKEMISIIQDEVAWRKMATNRHGAMREPYKDFEMILKKTVVSAKRIGMAIELTFLLGSVCAVYPTNIGMIDVYERDENGWRKLKIFPNRENMSVTIYSPPRSSSKERRELLHTLYGSCVEMRFTDEV